MYRLSKSQDVIMQCDYIQENRPVSDKISYHVCLERVVQPRTTLMELKNNELSVLQRLSIGLASNLDGGIFT